MISHLRLKTTKNISDSIRIQTNEDGFEFIVINHDKFDALFSLHGAHLIHFKIKNKPALIYTSKTAIYTRDKAIRGGVPICWPWFGNTTESRQKKLPSHGFARINKWMLAATSETVEAVEMQFTLSSTIETKKIWEHEFELTLNVRLSDKVELCLTTKNIGSKAFNYSGALHSYLHVADVTKTTIYGLAENYTDSLDKGVMKCSNLPLSIDDTVDSIYEVNPGRIILEDIANHRKISITNSGNDSVVIWNPWKQGAIAFTDMPDDGYKTMFCIESAITSKKGISVAPHESHSLQTVIKEI